MLDDKVIFGNCFQVSSKGFFVKHGKNITAVFTGGSKKRKFNNGDKHGHCQDKKKETANIILREKEPFKQYLNKVSKYKLDIQYVSKIKKLKMFGIGE